MKRHEKKQAAVASLVVILIGAAYLIYVFGPGESERVSLVTSAESVADESTEPAPISSADELADAETPGRRATVEIPRVANELAVEVQAKSLPEVPKSRESLLGPMIPISWRSSGEPFVAIERHYELELRQSKVKGETDDASGVPHIKKGLIHLDGEWLGKQSIVVHDRVELPAKLSQPSFQRTIIPEWLSTSNVSNPSEGNTGTSMSSALEGRVLQFECRPPGQSYTATVEDLETPGHWALVEGVVEDMDLRILQPRSGARVGETWKVSRRLLWDLISPGGDLQVKYKDSGLYFASPRWSPIADDDLKSNLYFQSEPHPSDVGSCTVTSEGVDESEHGRFHRMKLDIEVGRTLPARGSVAASSEREFSLFDEATTTNFGDTSPITVTVRARGHALWDEAWQRVSELNLEGAYQVVVHWAPEGKPPNEVHMMFDLKVQVAITSK